MWAGKELTQTIRTLAKAIADNENLELWDAYGYPRHEAVQSIATSTGLDETDVYYDLKYMMLNKLFNSFTGLLDEEAVDQFLKTGPTDKGGFFDAVAVMRGENGSVHIPSFSKTPIDEVIDNALTEYFKREKAHRGDEIKVLKAEDILLKVEDILNITAPLFEGLIIAAEMVDLLYDRTRPGWRLKPPPLGLPGTSDDPRTYKEGMQKAQGTFQQTKPVRDLDLADLDAAAQSILQELCDLKQIYATEVILLKGEPPDVPHLLLRSKAGIAEAESREYPLSAWNGTLYGEFAATCGRDNHIPRHFFVESLKTIVGAVCGHRMNLEGVTQEARFYTVLLGPGGIGKSTAANWALNMLLDSGLVYNAEGDGPPKYKNIGCYVDGGFASAVGLIEAFCEHPRILQFYDELAVPVEKFTIAGSGRGFMGVNCSLYESSSLPPTHRVKGVKHLPKEAHASLLGCSTAEKWEAMFAKSGAEESGFFQRLNLAATDSTDTVALLKDPDLNEVRRRLIEKIEHLEDHQVEVVVIDGAQKLFTKWHESLKVRTAGDTVDISGRLNVIVLRNALHLAWLLERPAPGAPGSVRYSLDANIMARAIALADHELETRRAYRPVIGNNDWALCENLVRKWMSALKSISRKKLYDKIHAERFGLRPLNQALINLEAEGLIKIMKTQPGAAGGRSKEIIDWVG
jgi:hypothetical protein